MSLNSIELEFGDGSYVFALPLVQITELQRRTDNTPIGRLYGRVWTGIIQVDGVLNLVPGQSEFYVLDIVETIRHGLIGGEKGTVNGEEVKVTPLIANKLVDTYVLGRPLIESWGIAAMALFACIKGFEPPKKELPAKARARGRKTKTAA